MSSNWSILSSGGGSAPVSDNSVTRVRAPIPSTSTPLPGTSQSTSDLKGDHASAHMFPNPTTGIVPGLGKTLFDGGTITSGALHVLVASVPFFNASDVGRIVTVQGADVSGSTLATTIAAYTDSQHVTLTIPAVQAVSAQIIFVGDDNTTSLLNMLVPSGSDGSGLCQLLPIGQYLVSSGILLIPNPQSGLFIGQGSRFGSTIVNKTPLSTASVLALGNGTSEPHSYVLEKLAIDANGAQEVQGVLYLNRTNLMAIRDVIVQGLGGASAGIANPSNTPLFGEMTFWHVAVYGVDGTIPASSVGFQLFATGNVDFYGCNIEQVFTDLIFTGASQVRLVWFGGHIERIGDYGFWLVNCQPTIHCDLDVGGMWLGNDVVNGDINLTNCSFLWASGGLVDNGFGNRIRRTASAQLNPETQTNASYSTGVVTEGDEWLYVPGIVDDPTFLNGVATWSGPVTTSTISFPGVKRGASMVITSGSASRTFTAQLNTDYLLQVGILTKDSDIYRITVANSTTTVWDSGNFSAPIFGEQVDQQSFKVYRKSIPVTTDSVFTVTIYAVNSGQTTIVPLLLISQSAIQMANYASYGTGLTVSGSGVTLELTQNTSTGFVYTIGPTTFPQRCFARAVITAAVGITGVFIGVGGDGAAGSAGPQIQIRQGVTAEYTIPLMSYPLNGQLHFGSLSTGGVITISEIGIYLISEPSLAPYVTTSPDQLLPNALPLTAGLLFLGSVFGTPGQAPQSNWQTPTYSGTGFKRAVLASNISWNESTGVWDVTQNGSSDWAMMILDNGGNIAFACQNGLTQPTTLTDTQVESAIKFKILASGNIVGSTTLVGNITSSTTALTVASGTNIINGGYITVDNEIMLVSAGGGTGSLTVVRAQLGSTAVAHNTGAFILSATTAGEIDLTNSLGHTWQLMWGVVNPNGNVTSGPGGFYANVSTGTLWFNTGGFNGWNPVTGITQLTGDVTAGPGSGSVAATVAAIQGNPVLASSPTMNQVLQWNGSDWVPATLSIGLNQLTGDVTAGPGSGSQAATLAKIQGNPVSATSPATNQVLQWNGSDWVPATLSSGSPSQVVNATASGNLSLTGTPTLIPGTSITLNLAGAWLVRGYATIRAQYDDNICSVELNLNGSTLTPYMQVACPGSAGIIGVFQLAYEWVVITSGTSTAAELVASKSGSGGVSSVELNGTAIIAEWLHP